jgi:hypothetical protein
MNEALLIFFGTVLIGGVGWTVTAVRGLDARIADLAGKVEVLRSLYKRYEDYED